MNHDQINPPFAPVWAAFLMVASTAGSLLFACATPFAAIAAIAALTLPARLALVATMGVWLGNQAVGFLLLGYPFTASSLAWGPVLGGSAILAAAAAIYVARGLDRADLRRWPAAIAAALVVQQGLVLAAGLVEGTASLKVAAGVIALNAVWFAALAIIQRLTVGIGRMQPAPAR
jgi:hypothetical protein